MNLRITIISALTLIGVLTGSAVAEVTPFFQPLGVLEGFENSEAAGISHDGTAVSGRCFSDSGAQTAMRWTATDGMIALGSMGGVAQGHGVSNGGHVVVGVSQHPDGTYEAFRWTAATGMEGMGATIASACSADGSVIVGMGPGARPFRWTEESGVVVLPGWAGPANDVSADGSVVVGHVGVGDLAYNAFRWDESGGWEVLPAPEGAEATSAMGISADSSAIVGHVWDGLSGHSRVVMWNGAESPIFLPQLPSGRYPWRAGAISGDGSVVAGSAHGESGFSAFVWDQQRGSREFVDVLVNECGIDLMGWMPTDVYEISADGLTLVGVAVAPDGHEEAFVARIPEPGGFALMLVAAAAALRRKR